MNRYATFTAAAMLVGSMASLTACSSGSGQGAPTAGGQGAASSSAAISSPTPRGGQATAKTAPVPAASRSMGAPAANADTANVDFTKCQGSSSGVAMEARVTNATKETRTFILTGLAYGPNKKSVGSAALMVGPLKPGESGNATGNTGNAVKVKVTCEVSDIASMAQ